ncbi:hypothetical protein GCK32_021888, partial [Trichostrongylus colubriformis]
EPVYKILTTTIRINAMVAGGDSSITLIEMLSDVFHFGMTVAQEKVKICSKTSKRAWSPVRILRRKTVSEQF